MNKRILGIVTVVQLLGNGVLFATTSDYRSPLNDLQRRGHVHYDFAPLCPEKLWHTELWGAGYVRTARDAFIACGDNDICCSWNKSTTDKAELAQLFFGKSCFRGEEAFAGGIIIGDEVSGNPALALNKLCPRIKYSEKGVFLGLNVVRDVCDSNWHLGMRASIPVKVIDVEQARSCGSEQIEQQAGDVVVRRQEFANPTEQGYSASTNNVNAYRLDYLSTLRWTDGTPIVQYGDGTAANPTRIAFEDVTELNGPYGVNAIAPMYVISAPDGTIYSAIPRNDITETGNLARDITAVPLPANGFLGAGGSRGYFSSTTNYAASLEYNRSNQSTLFLIPNLAEDADAHLVPEANLVQNQIDYVINRLDASGRDSALQFFEDHGVDFCTAQHNAGMGDLYLEWYAGYENECREWFWNGLFAFKIPTAKKNCDEGYLIYYQSTGNNGHFEFRLGTEGGWHPSCWFAFRSFLSYTHVFEHTERRAPFFEGASVKNIPAGDPIPVKVSYDYFLGNADITLIHPRCENCGVAFGYELYAKGKDKMCCCSSTATDFFNYEHFIDCDCCPAAKTNTTTHKLRGEFFVKFDCCELFIGGYTIIAGRYAMKEAEGNIGISLYF